MRNRMISILIALACFCVPLLGSAAQEVSPAAHIDPLVFREAPENLEALQEAFASPDQAARPRTRFWVPEACIDEETVREDLREIASLGYGGIEVVSYAQFVTGIPEDYAWGTENWENAMGIIVDECRALGLEVSVTNGPSWPISMPNIESADDVAASYELTWGVELVVGGGTYSGPVPQRNKTHAEGTPHLISVAAYQLTGKKTLDFATYTDLMEYVTPDETDPSLFTIEWTVPGDDLWMMFSFWEQPTAQKTNNYYVIDHYGLAGAQACIDYWENAFASYPYMSYVSAIFEDSLEVHVDKEWTHGFADIFREQKGYDLIPFLPAIGGGDFYNTDQGPDYAFADPALAQQIKNDYDDVVTYCYTQYHLKPMQEMCERHNMALRAQVAYNKPMNTVTSALYAGIPETEGLNRNSIDFYRLMASSAHMRGIPVYSFEAACEFNGGSSQSYEDLANWFKRSWAAGVNRQVTHGSSYSGKSDVSYTGLYGNLWPGFMAFGGVVTNEWNRNTSNALARRYIDYFARVNSILQKTQKVDLAIYYDTFDDHYMTAGGDGEDRYPDGGALNAKGYSYEFVSPATLTLPTAVVDHGVLNENGPAYKAIVIHDATFMDLSNLEALYALAKEGLPLIFVGEMPSCVKYYSNVISGNTDEDMQSLAAELLALPCVVQAADYAAVPDALITLGIVPDAAYDQNADVLAKRTTDGYGDYYYLYNYNKASAADVNATSATEGTVYPGLDKEALVEETLTVTLQGSGYPYELNAWSGEILPLQNYTATEHDVTLTVTLGKDDAILIALLPEAASDIHAENSSVDITQMETTLYARLTDTDAHTVTLSGGEDVSVQAQSLQRPFDISAWELQIEAIQQGESIYFRDSAHRTIDVGEITELKGWKDLDDQLAGVSGTGIYTATFSMDAGWNEHCGALLDLGEVEDIYTLTVNGTELPFTNQVSPRVDIGPYLVSGENILQVTVATTIYNYASSIGSVRRSDSLHPLFADGLLGTDGRVTVTPYQLVPLN
ncbi:MAG: hypothetical protein IJ865_08125 [Clostridia bacterium]|nr:hypothetical protein [Clostridia bacterium]